jgi:hypothetical protein
MTTNKSIGIRYMLGNTTSDLGRSLEADFAFQLFVSHAHSNTGNSTTDTDGKNVCGMIVGIKIGGFVGEIIIGPRRPKRPTPAKLTFPSLRRNEKPAITSQTL